MMQENHTEDALNLEYEQAAAQSDPLTDLLDDFVASSKAAVDGYLNPQASNARQALTQLSDIIAERSERSSEQLVNHQAELQNLGNLLQQFQSTLAQISAGSAQPSLDSGKGQ